MMAKWVNRFWYLIVLFIVACSTEQPETNDSSVSVLPVLVSGKFVLYDAVSGQLESDDYDAIAFPGFTLDKIICYDRSNDLKKVREYSIEDNRTVGYVEMIDSAFQDEMFDKLDLRSCRDYQSFLTEINSIPPLDTIINLRPSLDLFIRDTVWGYVHNGHAIWTDSVKGKSLFLQTVRGDDPAYYTEAEESVQQELIEDIILLKYTYNKFIPWIIYNLQNKPGIVSDEDVACYFIR